MSYTYNPESKKFDLWVEDDVSEDDVSEVCDSEVSDSEVKEIDENVEDFIPFGSEQPAKHRGWVATIWNVDNTREFYENIVANKINGVTFIAYGEEVTPTTKRRHHQAFFYTKVQRRTSEGVIKKLATMWGPTHSYIRMMRGNFCQNKKYCEKDGLYTEIGEKPKMGRRCDLNELKDMILDGEITVREVAKLDATVYHQYGRTLHYLEHLYGEENYRQWETKGVWIYGISGSGKTHDARHNYGTFHPRTHYVKSLREKYWDGYHGQEVVILEDFRGEFAVNDLTNWVDKGMCPLEIKGKPSVQMLAKTFVITSIYHPKDIFTDSNEPMEQLYRRFEIIHKPYKWVAP